METLKIIGDGISGGIVIATLIKILPPIAALVSIMWVCFQFYHSPPVKEWRDQRKQNGNS